MAVVTATLAILPWAVLALQRGPLAQATTALYVVCAVLLVADLVWLLGWLLVDLKQSHERSWAVFVFTAAIIGIVGCWATVYLVASADARACFKGSLTPLDAIYATVGNLSTIGSGSIPPESQWCRGL
ncbi:MAG TPA: hypothetical protein VN889_04850, partial [Solirubrobacteraceae bacterium]|nr:hypothetical protein [Solirubrobacteraceae bacterium]